MTSLVLSRFRPDDVGSGAALRNRQNILGLASLGPVDVVSIGVDTVHAPVAGVREWAAFTVPSQSVWHQLTARGWVLRRGMFPGVERFHLARVTRWIAQRAASRRYDLAVVEGISLSTYVPELGRVARRVVFDAHNVESALCGATMAHSAGASPPVAQRIKMRFVQQRLAEVERKAVGGADIVWACSDLDAHQLASALRAATVAVVPNGVNVDAYRPHPSLPESDDWRDEPITLVYLGLFSYSPNEDAAMRLVHDVLPAIRMAGADARVLLVGRDPTSALLEAARHDPAVTVTGAVESVIPYLQRRCVVTLPITVGGGTRLKIVEAFAAGRPVVTTGKGAEGLAVVDGQHLLLREENAAMAQAVIELWYRPRLRTLICLNALELAHRRYSWPAAAAAIAASLNRPLDLPIPQVM